jgi:mono/diheme cytochrome c family protein
MRVLSVFLFIISFGMLIACGSKKTEKGVKKVSGFFVFKEYCVSCHGVDGRMGLNGAKSIPDSKLNLEERIKHITNGKGTMQPYKGILTEAEIKAVAAYSFEVGKEKK